QSSELTGGSNGFARAWSQARSSRCAVPSGRILSGKPAGAVVWASTGATIMQTAHGAGYSRLIIAVSPSCHALIVGGEDRARQTRGQVSPTARDHATTDVVSREGLPFGDATRLCPGLAISRLTRICSCV